MRKLFAVVCLIFTIIAFTSCTIVPDENLSQDQGYQRIDIAGQVKSIWNEEIMTYIDEYSESLESAAKKLMSSEMKIACVRDTIKVDSFDDASQSRALVMNSDLNLPVRVQVGPIIRGTAVRDGLSFITADQYSNQVEFAAVSRELNKQVTDVVLKDITPSELVHKEIQVDGFVVLYNDYLLITPVKVEVLEGD